MFWLLFIALNDIRRPINLCLFPIILLVIAYLLIPMPLKLFLNLFLNLLNLPPDGPAIYQRTLLITILNLTLIAFDP